MAGRPEFVKWIGDGFKVRRMRWGGFEYDEAAASGSRTVKAHEFRLVAGEWPDDGALITLNDGGDPRFPNHFGGRVTYLNDGAKRVETYID